MCRGSCTAGTASQVRAWAGLLLQQFPDHTQSCVVDAERVHAWDIYTLTNVARMCTVSYPSFCFQQARVVRRDMSRCMGLHWASPASVVPASVAQLSHARVGIIRAGLCMDHCTPMLEQVKHEAPAAEPVSFLDCGEQEEAGRNADRSDEGR